MKHIFNMVIIWALLSTACTDREGVTPLMVSARNGDVNTLKLLISHGANLDEKSKYGWTALMFAAREGHAQAVKLLLDAGANPNIESQRIARATLAPYPRTTALREAIRNHHLSIAHTLVDGGASVDPGAIALAGGSNEIALLAKMHTKGANLNQTRDALYSPSALYVASKEGKLENVKWLIGHGADPNSIASRSTALLAAVYYDHPEVVQYLMDRGADPNLVVGSTKTTALLRATTKYPQSGRYDRNLQVIEILLSYGADKNYRSGDPYYKERTALEFLQDDRVKTLERIKLNRYGEKQRLAEEKLLRHRDAIIDILER